MVNPLNLVGYLGDVSGRAQVSNNRAQKKLEEVAGAVFCTLRHLVPTRLYSDRMMNQRKASSGHDLLPQMNIAH